MDRVLEACGATIVYYPVKTHCCGGSQKGTLPEIGLNLIRRLLTEAQRNGAEAIATVCPLCQFNLEAFQDEASTTSKFHIPVLYFTQLLALALGVRLNEADSSARSSTSSRSWRRRRSRMPDAHNPDTPPRSVCTFVTGNQHRCHD